MTSEFSDALASAQWDYANNPAAIQLDNEVDKLLFDHQHLSKKVQKWKRAGTPTALDIKAQEDALEKYQPLLDAKEEELCWRRGDYPDRGAFPRPDSMKGDVPPQQCAAPPTNPGATLLRRNKWDEHANRKLLIEMNLPGATLERLGKQYGVSRQRMAVQVKKAKESLGSKNASPFDVVRTRNSKK